MRTGLLAFFDHNVYKKRVHCTLYTFLCKTMVILYTVIKKYFFCKFVHHCTQVYITAALIENLPKSITLTNSIQVQVVSSLKLLGCTIDSKLNFNEYFKSIKPMKFCRFILKKAAYYEVGRHQDRWDTWNDKAYSFEQGNLKKLDV